MIHEDLLAQLRRGVSKEVAGSGLEQGPVPDMRSLRRLMRKLEAQGKHAERGALRCAASGGQWPRDRITNLCALDSSFDRNCQRCEL